MMLLEIRDIHVHYNKVAALKGVSIEVPAGGIVTIIGANGAGKSTTLRALSGLTRISAGEIWFDSERIDNLPPEKIVARGIAQVPEGRRVFPDLTVEENLRTGAFLRNDKPDIERDSRVDDTGPGHFYRNPTSASSYRGKRQARTSSASAGTFYTGGSSGSAHDHTEMTMDPGSATGTAEARDPYFCDSDDTYEGWLPPPRSTRTRGEGR